MSTLRNIYRRLSATYWNIAIVNTNNPFEIAKGNASIHWLKHNLKTSWFADPFILSIERNEAHILVEEWVDELRRGRISKLIVDLNDYSLKEIIPILELDTHLSFPSIFRVNNEVYVYPENCKSGSLFLYKYDENKEKLVLHTELVNLPLIDAILDCIHFDNRNLIFSANKNNPNGEVLDIYEAPEVFGDYKKIDEIVFDRKIARNAGAFFKLNDKIIRPAQDCELRYGHGLVFQEVEYSNKKFKFTNIDAIYPSSPRYNLGVHTFNTYKGISVIDGYAYRTPYIGATIKKLGLSKLIISILNSNSNQEIQ